MLCLGALSQASLGNPEVRAAAPREVALAAYALVQAGDPEAIDVYLAEQDAQHALEDCLRDEPGWRGLLSIEEIEPPDPPVVLLN